MTRPAVASWRVILPIYLPFKQRLASTARA